MISMPDNLSDELYAEYVKKANYGNRSSEEILADIEKLLSDMSKNMSQSSARDSVHDGFDSSNAKSEAKRRASNATQQFFDGLEEGIAEAAGINDVKRELQGVFKQLADDIGVSLQDLPGEFGKQISLDLADALKGNDLVGPILDEFGKWRDKSLAAFKDTTINTYQQYMKQSTGGIGDAIKDAASGAVQDSILDAATSKFGKGAKAAEGAAAAGSAAAAGARGAASRAGMSAATKAVASGVKAAMSTGPQLAILLGVEVLTGIVQNELADLNEQAQKVGKSFNEFTGSMKNASRRDMAERERRTDLGNERLKQDLESIIREPYQVLSDATDRMVQVWEDALRVINQTQGYSKEELQTLIGDYAERLRSEGLSNVVSVADFTSSLGKVLESGLSGEAAEEFAYLATKLNAAIPTEDFFSYANTYAEIAANAIKNGKSQSDALQYANKQLEIFASNVLYASREISGGFNAGLQDASDLFSKSVAIAETAHSNNAAQISGVLTSVSAITGAIAPDLASSVIDAIYNAAVGGNSSEIVALRSLAGINASNTEFLNQFVRDPQGVFVTLFKNLANMQQMSQSNYMEVAEGLSSVFGLDTTTLARVDFNYLAQAIENMSVSTAALNQNLDHLASGESTTSAEQMRIRQINQYMIDEGLAYVLDNEVARSIQQHLWDEQIAQDIMENEFAVNLRGDALSLLTDLVNFVRSILTFMNPIGHILDLVNLAQTTVEALTADDKVRDVLEAGKIGKGNKNILNQLTTYGKQLQITNSYLALLQSTRSTGSAGYTWNTIGKSQYASLGYSVTGGDASSFINTAGYSAEEMKYQQQLAQMQSSFDNMVADMPDYFGNNLSKTIETAIKEETERLTSKIRISDNDVKSLAREYLANPDKYGLTDVLYDSNLANNASANQLSSFTAKVQETIQNTAENLARANLEAEQRELAKYTAESTIKNLIDSGEFGNTGYDAWVAAAEKYGIDDYLNTLKELGYKDEDVRNYFNTMNDQIAARQAIERDKAEEEFWANTQELLHTLNTNIHDVFDKGDVMGILWPGIDSWLADIDSNGSSGGPTAPVAGSGFRGEMNAWLYQVDYDINSFHEEMITQFKEFRQDWTNYYIKHTTYNEHLTGSVEGTNLLKTLNDVKSQSDKNNEDVLNALTEALVNMNVKDLLDPTVQQNLMLAQILRVVQGIFQQNNTQGKLKLPDAIAALATGMQVVEEL